MERKQWDAISHRIVAVWWKCCERGYLIRSSISLISSAGISADCLLEGTRRLLSRETGAWETSRGAGSIWLMSSGVLGCVYVYRCILHFDYQKHRISWIKVLKNLIMHYNTSKLGPRLCCWDGTLYRIKWDSFSVQTWVGLRDQAENGSSTGHPWWWWQRGMLLGSENVAKLFQRVMMQSNLRWSKDTHWTRQWFLSSQYSGAKLVWN